MYRLIIVFCLLGLAGKGYAQNGNYLYIDAENDQPFYIKLADKVHSSSASGYLLLTGLNERTLTFSIGFPRDLYPEQRFTIPMDNDDQGFHLKQLPEKGWTLINLKTNEQIFNSNPPKAPEDTGLIKRTDAFSVLLSKVVNDAAVLISTPHIPDPSDKRVPDSAPGQPVAAATGNTVIAKQEEDTTIAKREIARTDSPDPEHTSVPQPEAPGIMDTVGAKSTAVIKNTTAAKDMIIVKDMPAIKDTAVARDVVVAKDAPAIKDTAVARDVVVAKDAPAIKDTAIARDVVVAKDIAIAKDLSAIKDTVIAKAEVPDRANQDMAITVKDNIDSAIALKQQEPIQKEKPIIVKNPSQVLKLYDQQFEQRYEATYIDKSEGRTDTIRISYPVTPVTPAVAVNNDNKDKDDHNDDSDNKDNKVKEETGIREVSQDTSSREKVVLVNTDCKNFANEQDVDKLRVKILNEDNIERKFSTARKYFKTKCFTVKQIKALSELFPEDEYKYQFFELSYPFISDFMNFPGLEEQFMTSYYKNRFKTLIRN